MTNERPLTAEEYAEAEFARGYTKGFEKSKNKVDRMSEAYYL